MFNIKYNPQLDNENYKGKFPGSIQCFGTSAVMFLSNWRKEYENKSLETAYIDDVEATVGKPGTAEQVKGWTGRSSQWWLVHLAALKKLLPNQNIVYSGNMTLSAMINILKTSPVIFGTFKMGELPGGHIVLVVGYDSNTDSFILEDPFGNPNSNYKDRNGHQVKVSRNYLQRFASKNAIYSNANVSGLPSADVKKKTLLK